MTVPRRVMVPLPPPIGEAFWQLCQREFRHPRDQAQKLIVESLRREGALTDPESIEVRAAAGVAAHEESA
jgi:hypothetical protein